MVAGEMAVVTDGRIAVTLLQPATDGGGTVLSDRTPRLSQLIFGAAADALTTSRDAALDAGLSVTPSNNGFFIIPEVIEGVLGLETAVVVVPADTAVS